MRNPLAVFFERKTTGQGGALGSLIAEYLRGESAGAVGRVSDDQAMRVAAFASCVRLIACNVGALPLGMFKRTATGREPVTTSLSNVLDTPNPWQTGQEFREQLTGHVLMRGNAYAWINWVTGVTSTGQTVDVVKELIPLDPDRVLVEQPNKFQPPQYFLQADGKPKRPLPHEEVFHLRGYSSDGVVGRSILDDAREVVGGALATQRFARRLFDNDATAGVILRHPSTLSEPAATRLREQWDGSHRGETRRTAVLEEGMTVEKLTIAPNDAQFLETRQMSRAEIAGLFPVPPHLIGDVDRSTSWGTGIEQQQIAFLQFTLLPLLLRWENTITRALINQDRTFFVKHTLEGFLRGDSATRAAFYKTMVELDAMTPNEVRALDDRNPLDGGDRTWSEIQRATTMPAVTN